MKNIKVSAIKISLSTNDLFLILTELIEKYKFVRFIRLVKIEIFDQVKLHVKCPIIFNIDIIAYLNFIRANDSIIHAELMSSELHGIGLPSMLNNKIIKRLSRYDGITYKNGIIIIDIKELLHDYKQYNFDVSDVYLTPDILNIDLKNVEYFI
jgi:hypothetical protein